jgi:SPP1 gp7 family putative phage head morphogenesis protein
MSDTIGFNLNSPPAEAIDYLKSKGYTISFDFDELMHDAQRTSFTVAKVMQLDLLADIHQSLLQAQAKGTPFEQWKKDLIPTLKAKQWWGEQEIYDERTGEYKTIRIDGNRLKTIFQTNINTSYAVGRYQQMQELPEEFAYWRYWAIMDSRSRPTHARKHGTILPKTSPWWKTNYPPNGWNCRCKVQAVTQDMIDAKGWAIAEKEPERLADVDFGYDIGAGANKIDDIYFQKSRNAFVGCKENNAKKQFDCDYARLVFMTTLVNINKNINLKNAPIFTAGVYEIYDRENKKPKAEQDLTGLAIYHNEPVVGSVSLDVFEFLVAREIITASALIYLTRHSIGHSVRNGKKGALTLEQFLTLPEILQSDDVYFDTKNKTILYVHSSSEKTTKIAIAVNYSKQGNNEIVTAMEVSNVDFIGNVKSGLYIKIK